ncbi:MAG: hypothetical protein A4E28_01583 [Methanocella sp. PtaU1.Bin125]|nr:MAG: hypothetical protein A4E28_01583 [Methanocella sp. PtaU1.Bin125]
MNGKTGMDTYSRKIELINKKVKEINERRRGMKITTVEDELDRQELRNYIRFLGVEPGNIRLESLEETAAPRDRIFYATLAVEGLIEIAVIYFAASLLLKPEITTTDWAMCGLLLVIFGVLGYRIYKDTRVK